MPAYVALALVSIRRALRDRFVLLTRQSALEVIDSRILEKSRAFESLPFTLADGIEAIVAKSDFIRMFFVYSYGGAWLDADTLLFRDPSQKFFPTGLSSNLHWHSECFFASQPGNSFLARALTTGLDGSTHAWGNPGRIKDIVAQADYGVVNIAGDLFDPGYIPRYNFSTCEVMHRQDVSVEDFLRTDVTTLKLYNTFFRRTAERIESVEEFLTGGSLLAKLFLHIEADKRYWLAETEQIMEYVS